MLTLHNISVQSPSPGSSRGSLPKGPYSATVICELSLAFQRVHEATSSTQHCLVLNPEMQHQIAQGARYADGHVIGVCLRVLINLRGPPSRFCSCPASDCFFMAGRYQHPALSRYGISWSMQVQVSKRIATPSLQGSKHPLYPFLMQSSGDTLR